MQLMNLRFKLVTIGALLFFMGISVPVKLTAQTNANGIPITGVVLDQNREAVLGVDVLVKGTTIGTATDADGNFSLQVPNENAVLQISYLGYKTQEILVGNKRKINVTLVEDSKALAEVTVTAIGYGTMRKSDLTGAISSVSSDAISKSVATSLDQALQGRAAGVDITPSSGMPGAASSVRIRGISSINSSNEPIYVIDGVIMSQDNTAMNSNVLSSINPADIVSVDILKDASATAIYGSRASNGVIIITTRRGEAGHSIINFNSYVGFQQIPKKLDVLNLQQYANIQNLQAANGLLTASNSFVRPDLLGPGTNWQDELFQTAPMQNYNLSISGGNEEVTYNVAAGYVDQRGIAQGSGFKRWNLTSNVDAKVKPWAKVGANMAFSNTNQDMSLSNQDLINKALTITPNVPVKNADGSYATDDVQWVPTNPVALAALQTNTAQSFGIRGNSYLELAPKGVLEGLTYRFEVGFDYGLNQGEQFLPTYTLSASKFNTVNQSSRSEQFNKYWTYRNILTYDKKFGSIHHITAMLGQEYQQSGWTYLSGSRTGFPTNLATDLTLGDGTTASNNNNSGTSAILSQFGRLFYSLEDTYMFTATLRHDGTSTFAPGKQWGWFPSAAFAWRLSQYGFLKDVNWMNNLKLRLGWGLTGNQNIPSQTAWYAVYNPTTTTYGTGLYPGNTPNSDITWESTAQTNIGLDASFFQSRIDLAFDWYNRTTNNLLMQSSLPGFVGTSNATGSSSSPWVNLGSLQNRGVEITVNTQNIVSKDFKWNSNIVFSTYRNKVLKLNSASGAYFGYADDSKYGGGSTIVNETTVGQPIGMFYGYQVIGRFGTATDFYMINSAGQIVRTPVMTTGSNSTTLLPIDKTTGVWIGDLIYKDVDGNGVIDQNDLSVIGNPNPKFTFGFGNTFSFKNVDLSVFFTGSYGNDVINYMSRYMSSPYRNYTNLLTSALNYAQIGLINPNGPDDYRNTQIIAGSALSPRMPLSNTTFTYDYAFSNQFIQDGSYIRLQTLSLAYTLPKRWLSHAGISALKIYSNVQNLFTWTKYKGLDPEVGQGLGLNNQSINGFDDGRYPSPRICTVGINLTF